MGEEKKAHAKPGASNGKYTNVARQVLLLPWAFPVSKSANSRVRHVPNNHHLLDLASGANATYRRAILAAIESQNDYHTRSNIDSIRRLTQDLLEDQTWNDVLFLQTLKSIVRKGDVDLFTKSTLELSPQTKRQRADSLVHRLEESIAASMRIPNPPPPLDLAAHSHVHLPLKPLPKRRPEHEKWKIVPKKEHDHSTYVLLRMAVAPKLIRQV
jgi:hypothetical protein